MWTVWLEKRGQSVVLDNEIEARAFAKKFGGEVRPVSEESA